MNVKEFQGWIMPDWHKKQTDQTRIGTMAESNNRRDFLKSVAVGSAAASGLLLNNSAQEQ